MNPPLSEATPPSFEIPLIQRFKRFIAADGFPCVGAKSALHRGQLHFLIEDDLRIGPEATTVTSIQTFSEEYRDDTPLFQSLVVLFRQPMMFNEATFERFLWRYLQRLHHADAPDYAWDPEVSHDPASDDFSFSVGGRGYYVIGLHPGASRQARRFSHPALVFNLHDQFERLRAKGQYEPISETIVQRDTGLQGNKNPMLTTFGSRSEARQYSGRAVDDDWMCPFHAR